jgi:hypothetical protein
MVANWRASEAIGNLIYGSGGEAKRIPPLFSLLLGKIGAPRQNWYTEGISPDMNAEVCAI